jgi:hypothetical protein
LVMAGRLKASSSAGASQSLERSSRESMGE